jgi:DNA-binding NarL/FixJ family response regulator
VHTHNNGDLLLHALDNPPPTPQIVFLDLNMPGKNGLQVLQEIRNGKNMTELPIVILSTSDDENTINQCRTMGANYFITKATDYVALKKSIDHALNIDWGTFRPEPHDFYYKN